MSNTITLKDMPVSLYSGDDRYHEGKKSRTLFVDVDDLNAIPSELFAVKISQSKNPELVGKPVFKYFQYRINSDDPWTSLAPNGSNPTSNLDDLKANVLKRFDGSDGAQFELNLKMHGKWGNINTPDGAYALYDEDHFPETQGDPNYYLKAGTICDIKLTPATSHGNDYYQVEVSTKEEPDDIFQIRGKSNMKYFGDDSNESDEKDDWL